MKWNHLNFQGRIKLNHIIFKTAAHAYNAMSDTAQSAECIVNNAKQGEPSTTKMRHKGMILALRCMLFGMCSFEKQTA